jgi:hypothetical protein
MEAKYRRMVKNFICRIIRHKKEEERLLKESDSFGLSQSESPKPAK